MTTILVPKVDTTEIDAFTAMQCIEIVTRAREWFIQTSFEIQHPARNPHKVGRIVDALRIAQISIGPSHNRSMCWLREAINKAQGGESFTNWFKEHNKHLEDVESPPLIQDAKGVFLIKIFLDLDQVVRSVG